MRDTKPLFQIDAAWLYVIAGLVVCAAGIIIPAQKDLQSLRDQFQDLKQDEAVVFARLEAHASFLDQLDLNDPSLLKRLAAAQLNMVPKSDTPVLVNASGKATIIDWIDAAVADKQVEPVGSAPIKESLLTRLSTGPLRLWFLGGGVLCVFIGIILTPGLAARRAAEPLVEDEDDNSSDPASETQDQRQLEALLSEPERARTPLASSRTRIVESFEPDRASQVIQDKLEDDYDDHDASSAISIEKRNLLLDSQDDIADDPLEAAEDSLFGDGQAVTPTHEPSSASAAAGVLAEPAIVEDGATRATTTDADAPTPAVARSRAQASKAIDPTDKRPIELEAGADAIASSDEEAQPEPDSTEDPDYEYVYLDESGRELTAEEIDALDDDEFEWVEVDDESGTGTTEDASAEVVVKRSSDRARR